MKIDINKALNAIKDIFSQSVPKITAIVDHYLEDSKERLTNLAEGAISGELSYAFVTKRLKEEGTNLKAYFLSLGQIIAADVEEAVNKAITSFEKEIKQAIPDSIEQS